MGAGRVPVRYGSGGLNRYGLVFRIRPDGTAYEVVHKFTGADGAWPGSRLVAGADGALYGSARDGGPGEGGVIYRIRLSPEAIIGSLIGKVEGLGTLKPGQGKSLVGKLELALQRLQAGDTLKAITMLEAFIHEVRALENAGILDPAQADGWIATAEGVIASISG